MSRKWDLTYEVQHNSYWSTAKLWVSGWTNQRCGCHGNRLDSPGPAGVTWSRWRPTSLLSAKFIIIDVTTSTLQPPHHWHSETCPVHDLDTAKHVRCSNRTLGLLWNATRQQLYTSGNSHACYRSTGNRSTSLRKWFMARLYERALSLLLSNKHLKIWTTE